MSLDYMVSGDVIIFGPLYNSPLDHELLSQAQAQCKKIIFSDYALSNEVFKIYINIFFEGENIYDHKYNYRSFFDDFELIGSDFNQPLDNSLHNCPSLTHIIFGWCFNRPLLNSLHNCPLLTSYKIFCKQKFL